MADRIAELRRQRALLQVHLAWLDREITRAGGKLEDGSYPPFGSTPSTAPFFTGSNPPLTAPLQSPAPTPASASSPAPSALPPPAPSTPSTPSKAPAEELLEKFRREPAEVQRDVRRGCLLYFVAALVALGFAAIAFYFLRGPR